MWEFTVVIESRKEMWNYTFHLARGTMNLNDKTGLMNISVRISEKTAIIMVKYHGNLMDVRNLRERLSSYQVP